MSERKPLDRVISGPPDDPRVCGHSRSEHYTYVCNGEDTVRCRACDPMAGAPAGNYVMESDTYVAAMYHAADHDFQPAESD